MAKRVEFQEMLDCVRRSLEQVPEHWKGRNIQFEIVDAGLTHEVTLGVLGPAWMVPDLDASW